MARKEVVSYTITCDVCGDEIPTGESDDAARKITFEGALYRIDTCARHREELNEIADRLKGFVNAGSRQSSGGRPRSSASAPRTSQPRRGTAGSSKPSSSGSASEVAAIRAWAAENGHTVGVRGRIPGKVTAAYRQANDAKPVTERKHRPRKAPAAAE